MVDPSEARVQTDLGHPDIVAGITTGRWRIIAFKFPQLNFAITSTEPDGTKSEYYFLADLTGYPSTAPMVRIWDMQSNTPLAADHRPRGNQRVALTFQHWLSDTVYRPWDRKTGPHNNNAVNLPHLAWRPDRRLIFIFEDLHGILNINARAHRIRASA